MQNNHQQIVLPQPVAYILWKLNQKELEGYVVGGAVRDLLLNRPLSDWDFTTNARPETIQEVFPESFYDNNFGTVGIAYEHISQMMIEDKWQPQESEDEYQSFQEQVYEITTFRTESNYTDNRRPDKVEWGKSIEEDLKRRDFTINAIAIRVNHIDREIAFIKSKSEHNFEVSLIDPYQGEDDVRTKTIKAVSDPHERFSEDALRMMRAIRFGAQLGFHIEPKTLDSIKKLSQLIENVSSERIRDELLKILTSNYPADGILLLYTSELLEFIIPELLPSRGVEQGGHHIHDVWTHSIESLRHCPSPDPVVRLAALIHDIGKPKSYRKGGPRGCTFHGHEVVGGRVANQIGKRLRLSKKQHKKLVTLVRWHMFYYQEDMTDAAIRRFIKRVGVDNINDIIMLRIGDRLGSGATATSWRLRELQRRIGEQLYEPLKVSDLKVSGHDVMEELNIKPGKQIGTILNALFEEVIEDTSKNNREYLIQRMKEIANN